MPEARARLDAHPATWLALRLLRSPLQRVSLVLVALCSFLAGLTFVGLCAVPGVIADQSATTYRHQVRHEPASTGVYAWTHASDWRDEHVINETVVAVAPGARIPAASMPPGVHGVLRTGDIWVSPALRRLADEDRDLAAAYPAPRLRALAPDVLESSRTLRAVRVVDPAAFRNRPEAEWPARPDAAFGDRPEFRTVNVPLVTLTVGAVVLLVAVPLWLLVTSAYAAVAAPRQRHETLLHLVGLPLGRARLLAGADATVLGALSGAAAAAVFPLVTHAVTAIPGTPAAWAPGQPSLTIPGVLLAVLAPALASLNASRRRRERPRPGRARLGWRVRWPGPVRDFAPIALLVATIAAVLLTPDLRMDKSPTSARIAVLLVGGLALGAVIALPILTRLLAAGVLWPAARRVTPASSALWVACARVARTSMPSGALGALAGIFVVAIAVVPLVAQVAPRDDITADLNRRGGRVLVAIQTQEPERTEALLNREPDVLGQWPAASVKGQMRFVMNCDDARMVLVETTCAPGSRIAPNRQRGSNDLGIDLSNILGAPWRIDVPTSAQSPTTRTASPGEPTLVAVRDTDAFWRLTSSAWDLDPLASVSAEYGGLIGGADQDYFVMQRWLSTALVVTLGLAGMMALLGALDLARRLLTDIEPLRAVGLAPATLRGVVACAAALRALALGLIMSATGSLTASALTRWSNADALTSGWTTLLVGVLITVVTAMTVLPAVATVGDPTVRE